MQLIKNLLLKWGCLHDWKLYNRNRVTYCNADIYYTQDTLMCKKCGKIIKIKL